MTAILLQPEVLYRMELGTGEPDEHGRVRVGTRAWLQHALSYALDDRPVDELLVAADEGKLNTAAEVAAEVRARLADESLAQDRNPRVLQFFREYFHYPFAREVFKDAPEVGCIGRICWWRIWRRPCAMRCARIVRCSPRC